uniref:MIP37007p1 n=1 Tax=Drosophila melanogaster TaxID=7227 RepID=R9UIF9_DROME|nr:MIP37007p1 [Drosophila melanogaster]
MCNISDVAFIFENVSSFRMNFGHHKQPFSAFNANNLANVCGAYAYLCRPWHVPSRRSNLASRAECTSCCSRWQVIRQKNSLHWRATRYNRTDGSTVFVVFTENSISSGVEPHLMAAIRGFAERKCCEGYSHTPDRCKWWSWFWE